MVKTKRLPLRMGTRQGSLLSSFLISIVVLLQGIKIRKKKVKLSLHRHNCLLCRKPEEIYKNATISNK